MTEKVQPHDFVELEYTGKLPNGPVFDTTEEIVAKKNHLHSETAKYKPLVLCVGEKQFLPGLDAKLVHLEVGKKYTFTLSPEEAFGKRDIKKMRIVPMSTFQEHKVQAMPGLQVDVDGERGIITSISGGRVIVNFNHPLAGKEVEYDLIVKRKITDATEKVTAFLSVVLRLPSEMMTVQVQENKATVTLPFEFTLQISNILTQKLSALTGLKEITFVKTEAELKGATQIHNH